MSDEPGKSTRCSGVRVVHCTAEGCVDAARRSGGSVKKLFSNLCKNDASRSVWEPSSR